MICSQRLLPSLHPAQDSTCAVGHPAPSPTEPPLPWNALSGHWPPHERPSSLWLAGVCSAVRFQLQLFWRLVPPLPSAYPSVAAHCLMQLLFELQHVSQNDFHPQPARKCPDHWGFWMFLLLGFLGWDGIPVLLVATSIPWWMYV